MVVRVKKTPELERQVKELAATLGCSPEEALGRLVNLWEHCLRDKTEDLAEKHIRLHMGPQGVEALIDSELAHRSDNWIRVRGVRKELDDRHRRTQAARLAALARHDREDMAIGPEAPVEDAPQTPDRVSDGCATESVTDALSLSGISDLPIGDLFALKPSSEIPRDLKQQAKGQPKPKRKAPEVPMPAGFAPGEWHRTFAAENGLDLAREFDRFVDGAEAKGRTYVSWPAALRTWLKNAAEWKKGGGRGGNSNNGGESAARNPL